MQNGKLEVKGGRLLYEIQNKKVTILGMEGSALRLTVPDTIEGMPVTTINKKAFFNCRYLRFLTLPDTLEKIENWAFAHCQQLERVELPRRPMSVGKDLFIGSEKLKEIVLTQQENETGASPERFGGMDIAPLLAMAAIGMEDPHLFSIEEAGTPEWLRKWDARMLVLLRENDNDGYDKQVLAGEEDYERTDQVRFRNLKRQGKVRLALMRLLHPCLLPEEIRAELEEYLREHTKGCSSEETWEVILREYGDDRRYYELFAELGCVNEDNFEGLLQDIGDSHTELKAYLMRYKEEKLGYRDFFDGLSLDF